MVRLLGNKTIIASKSYKRFLFKLYGSAYQNTVSSSGRFLTAVSKIRINIIHFKSILESLTNYIYIYGAQDLVLLTSVPMKHRSLTNLKVICRSGFKLKSFAYHFTEWFVYFALKTFHRFNSVLKILSTSLVLIIYYQGKNGPLDYKWVEEVSSMYFFHIK